MKSVSRFLSVVFVLVLLAGCQQSEQKKSDSSADMVKEEISISEARARTGPEGGMSAVYLELSNATALDDTLKSVDSEVAELTEVHESFTKENGAMGMRKIPFLELNSQGKVSLKPGGYHIMLIRLKRDLAKGDTVNVTLNLSENGSIDVAAPVVVTP